jgi:dihydroorotate dehydrogenase
MGGLSGKPLTSRSTEVIRFLSEKSKAFPIIERGIHSADDAIENSKQVLVYCSCILALSMKGQL